MPTLHRMQRLDRNLTSLTDPIAKCGLGVRESQFRVGVQMVDHVEDTGDAASLNVGYVFIPFVCHDAFQHYVSIFHENVNRRYCLQSVPL